MVQTLRISSATRPPMPELKGREQMRGRTVLAVGMALGLLGFASGGCGSGRGKMAEMGKVSGKVTYNGRAVSKGTVSFFPILGKGGETGQSALGELGSDGSFELTTFDTGDGAITGQHKVIVMVQSEGEKVA